jgi:hypothetical protein
MPDRTGLARGPLALAVALPLLLAVVVAVIALASPDVPDPNEPETGPLDVGTVTAPDAGSRPCITVLDTVNGPMPSDRGVLAPRRIEPPVVGVRAWAAAPAPVVLRCGVPRPAELGPSSPLLVVNGVNWLPLPAGGSSSSTTYAAVDRPVYLTVSAPAEAGSGPLQRVSDAITASLPQTPVQVR